MVSGTYIRHIIFLVGLRYFGYDPHDASLNMYILIKRITS